MFENNKTKWSEVYPMLEEKGDKEKYDKFFRAALKKFGVNSPADLPADKKKEFYNYVDKNYRGDHEQQNPNAEAYQPKEVKKVQYEIGTDEYTEYVKSLTPGQPTYATEETGLDEKAVSQQQQKLMGLAYAVKRGDIDAPSPEIQELANSMSMKDLKKYASTKHESLPKRVQENLDKIDGRTRMFREKVRKLYYEKIKKNEDSVDEAKAKDEAKKNKIVVNPELKEHKGYDLMRKIKTAEVPLVSEDKDAEAVLGYLKEHEDVFSATFRPAMGNGEQENVEGPASATMIARALKMSPLKVQQILDQGVKIGTVTRVGDAYSYGKVSIDDEDTADMEMEAEKLVDQEMAAA